MLKSPAVADAFHAIAEPRRRRIIETLAGAELPVGTLVRRLRLPQPTVSKHLAVLRGAGLVSVTRCGRHRLYRINAEELRPVHDWIARFERFWAQHLDRIKASAEQKAGPEKKE